MRIQLRPRVRTLLGLCALLAFHAPAFADVGDSAWSDLAPEAGGGVWSFVLNAAFALAFLVAARWLTRNAASRPRAQRRAPAGAAATPSVTQGFS